MPVAQGVEKSVKKEMCQKGKKGSVNGCPWLGVKSGRKARCQKSKKGVYWVPLAQGVKSMRQNCQKCITQSLEQQRGGKIVPATRLPSVTPYLKG